MIFLDVDDDFYVAGTRSELAAALVRCLPEQPDDDTLAHLAATVLGVEVMDVVVVEHPWIDGPWASNTALGKQENKGSDSLYPDTEDPGKFL